MTDPMVEFLSACLGEDEAAALASRSAPAGAMRYVDANEWSSPLADLATEDRVCREVEAGRKLVALREDYASRERGWDGSEHDGAIIEVLDGLLRDRAAVYSDRPGYDPAWAPETRQ